MGADPEPDDFDRFFARWYPSVVAVVRSLTPSRAVAEDVAQEAFAAALVRWTKVRRYDRPDLWVRRVALNRAVGVARRSGSEQRALTRLKAYGAAQVVAVDGPTPGGDDELWQAVRRLPARQAQLIALVYVDDRSIDKAATVLGLSASTARTHLQRARTTLAAALGADRSPDGARSPNRTSSNLPPNGADHG